MSAQSRRILVVADEYPWPTTNGYRMRLSNVVEALAATGDVDALWVTSDRRSELTVDPPAGLLRTSATVAAARMQRSRALYRWLRGPLPRRVVWLDWSEGRRAASDYHGPYDLVWYSHADAWLALHRHLPAGRTIVDLDNLEDQKLAQRRAVLRPRTGTGASPAQHLRRLMSAAADALDQTRWKRQQLRVAGAAEAVLVCSELDQQRLGVSNAVVIPNGYDPRTAPVSRDNRPPTVTMIGLMTYEPNGDGARFFIEDALAALQTRVPGVELRLVGRHDGTLSEFAEREGVVVTGEVECLTEELGRADVIVVPLRFGGGTRLKVLEGFASRIPVVSTAVGCEGLPVVPGEHLLVADDGPGLADACARLIDDPVLAASMTESAFELLSESFRWEPIRERIRQLVTDGFAAPGSGS